MRPLVVLLSAGCATNEASAPAPLELEMVEEGRAFGGSPDAPPAAPPADGTALSIVTGSAKPKLRDAGPGASDALLGALDYAQADAPEPEPASDPAPARSWFPEAFLWRPLVETGEDGVAELDVRVPDQLSTFRVLALAHDRRGQQAGATAALQTRLPLYVDPVTPDRLYRGDRIELPVQVVNGSPDGLTASLTVEASGALRGVGTTRLALSAGGSDVRRISLLAARPGAATVRAEVRSGVLDDAAERAIVVLPSGRPVVETVARRLTSEPFTLTGPSAADAASEHIEVVVFGGPWSVLQSEIERLAAGARPIDPAYGFALSAYVTDLAEATGVELDADRQKLLRIHAWQRLAAIARSPTPAQAVDFLASLRRVEGDELVDALVPQLIRQVKRAQRADGTWSTADRSTLQQVLVQTATAARALPDDERGPRLRAAGAVERSLTTIDDPYTAAVVLAAELVPTESRPALQAQVREAVEDGRLVVPETVRDARGEPPSAAEALAWSILALDATDEVAGVLVAELLGTWRADTGFGAGAADVVALEAIARALPAPDAPVSLTLSEGVQAVTTATLDPAQPRIPARFDLEPTSAETTLSIEADPPSPGLVVVATRRSWVPWRATDRVPGVDVEVDVERLQVGRRGTLTVGLAAPSGAVVAVRQALPAGVTVPSPPVSDRATVQLFADEIVVTTEPFQPGEGIEVVVPVVASFAGRFSTAPLQVSVDGGPRVDVRPASWFVRDAGR